uniref:FAD synthase n=2 Tax=Rhodosorus marinus TaxID=101924 RepID=A0A7S2ZDT6_9RHOD|mmetsp:Transcript_15297/g.62424  ORF Transcript_15297/g.62424 Transcript_15297/m.62424 type:complete len:428 (+) Transcript_15297:636-1919(+)
MEEVVREGYSSALALYDRIKREEAVGSGFARKLKVSIGTIEGALRLYGEDEISIAFNGGKDATVILHLYRAVVANFVREEDARNQLSEQEKAERSRVASMYIVQEDEFPEVEEYVHETNKQYAIDASFLHTSFKEALIEFLSERPKIQAFVLGTRFDDPDGADLQHFSPSSRGWPKFMRINPILEWDYTDVWTFLRYFELPYCSLYDVGYTSLGKATRTRRNPALICKNGKYLPGYMLSDKCMERAGRVSHSEADHLQHPRRTAGVVLFSSEIERGVIEVDRVTTLTVLRDRGVRLKKLVFMAEELEDAAKEIADMSMSFDTVITGGLIRSRTEENTLRAVLLALRLPSLKEDDFESKLLTFPENVQKVLGKETIADETRLVMCNSSGPKVLDSLPKLMSQSPILANRICVQPKKKNRSPRRPPRPW